ncbi:MAG: folate-binding protein YgfZ [Gammaproteobacteria bacterium]
MKTDWKTFLSNAGAEFQGDKLLHFGNPDQECEIALSGLVFTDLDYLGVIAVHGTDAGNFLQAQLSNDIRNCGGNSSQLSALCTPKGRILGLMRLFRHGDTFYLRLPADSLEAVLQRLRMFVLRADVTLEDVSNNFCCIGVSGADATKEIRTAAGDAPAENNQLLHTDTLSIIRVPGLAARFEIYANSLDAARDFWDSLNVHGAPVASQAWRLLEIQAGIPTIFAKTTELFVPQMVNLQLVDGVSFKKGCYPGQEIVARMQYLGTLKRRMYLGRIDQDAAVSPGDVLYQAEGDEQVIGRIVDAQPHPDGGQLALAVLQINSADSGDVRLGDTNGAPFLQQPLPYSFED